MNPSTVSALPELRVLVALADGKTLAHAGGELFISQPTASKLLQSLERKVGLRLTERRGRRLLLTAAGAEIAASARSVLSHVDELEGAVERMRAGEAGLLRVLATYTPGNYVLPPRLAAFHRTHPEVQMELSIVPNQEFWPRLLDGSHDLGVVPSPLEPVAPWLAADPLYSDPLVFFVPAGGPLARSGPLRPMDLDEMTIVAPFTLPVWDRALMHMRALGVNFRRIVDLGPPEAVKRLVAGGEYVGIHYGSVIEQEVRSGMLVPLCVEGVVLSQEYFLVRRRPPSLLPVAQQFCDSLFTDMATGQR